MPAAYDTYDYPSFWECRSYEHKAEVIAIKFFLSKIKTINTILEVGSGFGRHIPSFAFRAQKLIISDPSAKLLKIARKNNRRGKNIKFLQSSLLNLPSHIRAGTADLIIMIRVIHHLDNLEVSFATLNKLIKKRGYLILEFPNKRNLKAIFKEFFLGNFTFPIDIFPKDLRSSRSIKKNDLPFFNFHPEKINEILSDCGFKIIEKRSVSNLRYSPFKKLLSTEILLSLERILQKPLSLISFGPSIFILAQKVKNLIIL